MVQHTKQMIGVGVIRLGLQTPPVQRFGIGELPSLMRL